MLQYTAILAAKLIQQTVSLQHGFNRLHEGALPGEAAAYSTTT